jgi:hypothetical protein
MQDETAALEDLCGQRLLSGRGEMVLESAETSDDNAFVVALEINRKSAEESRRLNIFRRVTVTINIQACAGE